MIIDHEVSPALTWYSCNRPFALVDHEIKLLANTKTIRFWKILIARAERAYQNLLTCKFSAIYLKSSHCNGSRMLEGFVWEKQFLPPSHTWMVFHTNPCKFRNFQTLLNLSLKHLFSFSGTNPSNFWWPLQMLLLRYMAENLQVT